MTLLFWRVKSYKIKTTFYGIQVFVLFPVLKKNAWDANLQCCCYGKCWVWPPNNCFCPPPPLSSDSIVVLLKIVRTCNHKPMTRVWANWIIIFDKIAVNRIISKFRHQVHRSATRILLREELENGKFLWRHFDDAFSAT